MVIVVCIDLKICSDLKLFTYQVVFRESSLFISFWFDIGRIHLFIHIYKFSSNRYNYIIVHCFFSLASQEIKYLYSNTLPTRSYCQSL